MRAIRVASLALIGTAALALGAPAAVAADDDGNSATSFGFTATPATVAPGGTVTLNATECEAPTVTASSGVFETVTLNEGQSATTKIAADAKPDAKYDVTFDCKGEKGTAPLTITSGSGSRTDTGTVADVGTGTEAGTDAGAGTETGADAGTEMNTDSDADTGTETGGDASTELGTGSSETGTGTETGADASTELGSGRDTGTGMAKPDRGNDTAKPERGNDTAKPDRGTGMAKPDGGVKGGAGGSVSDLSPAQIAVGSALLAGALGAGVFLLRHRAADSV
ncbi:MSCRAMM family adhesin SdrC [Streptomyces sp. NBC_01210]|uniref:hypothetical protein n=1 Tax=Streptomyces sp. NBC_01210 TaxID=2903774 RepID=UPI002E135424|nr:MSCRAMM family adhesin SdrC [Streptomyces sp. NBC_01210]